MKIGILGGTFNPVHYGHLILAEEAYRILLLDKVIFIPCCLPPHKRVKDLILPRHRLEMVREAIRGNRHFAVSDIEIKAGGVSYTFETLEKFRKMFPRSTEIFLIVGSDALRELPRWKNFSQILNLARIVIATRPDFPVGKRPSWAEVIKIPLIDISSSEIRRRIKRGTTVKYLIPSAVEKYIEKNRLYKNE
ncbi:MAG: nicotinate-nucleotide adenylyltransferase [Candidatus Omnitrophica bacterium]|nr:nicotinate-nucleotide adenylyltransferase [Candidatus Omnitrophota bacterium]MCM8798128.1 nicotinate-nucleotide adenylyltransferase [Candidatus Omnitrophota bacterium]